MAVGKNHRYAVKSVATTRPPSATSGGEVYSAPTNTNDAPLARTSLPRLASVGTNPPLYCAKRSAWRGSL